MKNPNSKDIDCYIFIDMETAEENRSFNVICPECREEHMPDQGVFYEGSVNGYSPYDWICCSCKRYIHKEHKSSPNNQKRKTYGKKQKKRF